MISSRPDRYGARPRTACRKWAVQAVFEMTASRIKNHPVI
ncbi:hypothetical protein THTE_1669 [Thermogutta terrifontis]|uniref:Uncharacterized protein n=1 Tax=Thermogutta terrifontis TaxID=1331910 RepID=A0A286RE83_9BACT|nr:hypothetical protein THTE_1669 [Thermogutta terrifontis]